MTSSMKQTQIVVGEGVTGNVGSCSIQSNKITVWDSVFTTGKQVTEVNSCTGKIVDQFQYTDYAGLVILLFFSVWVVIGGYIIFRSDGRTEASLPYEPRF